MCDPFSLMVGTTVASTGLKMAGSIAAGKAKAATAEENAALLDRQAKARLDKGKFDTEQARRESERAAGTSRARIAASGVDARSFYDVLADDAAEAALQRAAIKYGAQSEAANLQFQAKGQRREASAARKGAVLGAFGAAVEGVNSAVSIQSPFDSDPTGGSPWLTTVFPTQR